MKPRPDLSIVIVTWNRRDLLLACLASLYRETRDLALEVCVVDNGSGDRTVEAVRGRFPQVRLIVNEENRGFTAGSNQGIRACSGRYVALLNNDTELRENAFLKLVRYLDAHAEAGAAAPRLYNPEGTVQDSAMRTFITIPSALLGGQILARAANRFLPSLRLFPEMVLADRDPAAAQEVAWVTGACMVIRREALDRIGLLDENIFMYCEDMEWCYRAGQANWKIVYLPAAGVVHLDHYPSKDSMPRIAGQHMANQVYFYRKYKGPARAAILGASLLAGSLFKLPFFAAAQAGLRPFDRPRARRLAIKTLFHYHAVRHFLSRARPASGPPGGPATG